MAKRTKTTARLGKVKKTTEKTEWKPVEPKTDVEQDLDSDDGSFMDDDTEDFLPAGWTGNSKGKKENKAASDLKQNSEVTVANTTQTKIILNTAELGNFEASLERIDLRSVTTKFESCTPVIEATPKIELAAQKVKPFEHAQSASETTGLQHITALELGASAPLVLETTSQAEQLHELIISLEQQLKSTRYQATATKAELESRITKQDAEIYCLRIELADKNPLRSEQYLALKKEKDEIEASYRLRREHTEAQCVKVTNDLGKLRNAHAELKTKNANLERQLASEKAKVTDARAEKDALREERQRQEFTIRQLQKQVNQGNASLTQLREELNRIRVERSNLMSEKSNLESELSSVRHRSTVASVSTSSQLLEAREAEKIAQRNYSFLQMRCNILKQEVRHLEREAEDLRDDKDSLGKELNNMRDKLCKANTRVNRQDKFIKELKSEVSDLERDRDLKAPILQIGVDIRLRNLEHAAETVLKIPRDEIDGAIIMNGNNAAHRANGAVDAALFQAGLVPEDYMESAEKIFEEMYTVAPSEYGGWSPKVLRLIDCRATIKTVKAFRRHASLDLREEHSEIDSKLLELHSSMGQRTFESSRVVNDLIERLESLTTEIVEADRSRGGRH
jgi:chromosome segregation ATPase